MTLDHFIQATGARDFHFLANEGNAGDGLIHAGFYRLARQLGINLIPVVYPRPQTGKFLLIVGAGAFCRTAWHNVEAVNYYSSRFDKVCILPSSFDPALESVAGMLRNLPANVTVFCRERISLQAVTEIVPKPERIFLDHDLAFEIDASVYKNPGSGTLNAFRTDAESLLHRVPYRNFDISDMGRETNLTLLMDTVANFETVYTDRLHVAIAGAILGKRVHLFEGNYHKIRGIYEYSLQDRFPKVTLEGTEELKRHLARCQRAANKVRLHHTIVRLPFGERLINFAKKRLHKPDPIIPVVS